MFNSNSNIFISHGPNLWKVSRYDICDLYIFGDNYLLVDLKLKVDKKQFNGKYGLSFQLHRLNQLKVYLDKFVEVIQKSYMNNTGTNV